MAGYQTRQRPTFDRRQKSVAIHINIYLFSVMIPCAMGPCLNEWERALCAAAVRPKTFVSERDMPAQKDLLEHPDVTRPRDQRKGRTRNYAGEIFQGPRRKIGGCDKHSIDMITPPPPEFFFEGPCLHSAIPATAPIGLRGIMDGFSTANRTTAVLKPPPSERIRRRAG